jgi:ATP-dependent RNA helicase RhlB
MELTYEYMNLPEFIAVAPEEITVEGIDQKLFHVGNDKKLSLLLGLLEREEWQRMLIFVNTKAGVEWLTQKLKGNGWPAERITGDLPQRHRFRLMEQFKKGKIRILVATDVASRGIHIEDISHVVNYDLPQDPENYIHRIGRTARAGKTGRALSLACETYVLHLEPLEVMLGSKIPVVWPEPDWYAEDRSKPSKARIPSRKASRGRARERKRHAPPKPAKPARKKSAFPGAFFGFGPPQENAPEHPPDKAAETPGKEHSKQRGRRKRRPSKAKGGQSTLKKAGD